MGLLRYPGGKTRLTNVIVQTLQDMANTLGLHEYREPCVGGGSVAYAFLTATPTIQRVWINDKDPGIACLWNAVFHSPGTLRALIQGFVPSVTSFYLLKETIWAHHATPWTRDPVTFGFMKLALHQLSFGGYGAKAGSPMGGWQQRAAKVGAHWSPMCLCTKIADYHQLLTTRVAPQLTVVTSTSAQAGVAVPVRDARAALVGPSEAAAHATTAVRASSRPGP